jgi:acetylornithine deacetylase/succinyl-diaminopimelate desuccinylase-like protein
MLETKDGRRVISQGESIHSSTPQGGDNALVKLCRCFDSPNLPDFVRFVQAYLSQEDYGASLAIDDGGDEWMGEILGRTTAVPTRATLEKDGVHLVVNVRQRVGTTRQQMEEAFQRLKKSYGFRFQVTNYMDGIRVDKDEPFLKAMVRVHEEYGVPCEFLAAPGTSYAKAMHRMVSWGPVLPGEPSCAHQENERIGLSAMVLATKMYARYIQQMTTLEG